MSKLPTPQQIAEELQWLGIAAQSVRYLASGAGSDCWLVEGTDRSDPDASLVARLTRTPLTCPTLSAQHAFEVAVLHALAGTGVTAALVARAEQTSIDHRPLLVLEYLRGEPLRYTPKHVAAAARLHARLHASLHDTGGATTLPPVISRQLQPAAELGAQAAAWFEVYESWTGRDATIVRHFRAALGRVQNTPDDWFDDGVPPVLVHGDSTYWNYRIDTHNTARIFDWDWARVSCCATDGAHLLSPVIALRRGEGLPDPALAEVYMDAYCAQSTFDESTLRTQFAAFRPLLAVHAAAWNLRTLALAACDPDHPAHHRPPVAAGEYDCCAYASICAMMVPEFFAQLTDEGWW